MSRQPSGFSMYFYDGRGNTKNNGRGQFTYDAKNNLISSITNDYNATYKVNAFNQGVSKTVDGQTTYFMYDGDKLIGEYDSVGNSIIEHVYIGNTPIAALVNNQIYSVHTDEIGTPRFITDSSNNQVWAWHNTDIYGGNAPVSNNGFTYNLRFAGQYFDFENGLHYNMNRTYDPKTGRYMQSDPIGLNGGDHTYNYVNGNPLSMTDPLGLRAKLVYVNHKGMNLNHWAINRNNTFYNIRGNNNYIGGIGPAYEPAQYFENELSFLTNYMINPDISITQYDLDLTKEQEDDLINALNHSNRWYNLYNNNCGDFVFKALEKSGIYKPTSNSLLPSGWLDQIGNMSKLGIISNSSTASQVIDIDDNGKMHTIKK